MSKKKSHRKKKSINSTKKPPQELSNLISKKFNLLSIGMLFVFLLIGLLLFEGSIVPMADDADYIMASYNFAHNGTFPGFRSTLFSILMAIPVYFFGTHFITFKLFSFLFAIIGFYYFLKTFKKIVHPLLLIIIGFIYATNVHIQFYSSSTMSESFFMMAQSIFLFWILNLIESYDKLNLNSFKEIKNSSLSIVLLTASCFVLSLSKNIGVVSIIALIFYFLSQRKYKLSFTLLVLYSAFKVAYDLAIRSVFDVKSNSQWEGFLWKNYYDHSQGKEDLSGMIQRFIDNFMHYSGEVPRLLGWIQSTQHTGLGALIFSILSGVTFLYLLHRQYSKNKKLFFLGLYIGGLLGATFLSQQFHWKQDRLILIYIPILLIFLSQSILETIVKTNEDGKKIVFSMMIIVLIVNLFQLPSKVVDNSKNLNNIFSGDLYSYYTQDWKNYLKMSTWIGENLLGTDKVACRKPNSSMVFSNGSVPFYGLYRSTDDTGEKVLSNFENIGVSHIMICNLRLNPSKVQEGYVIGTTRSYARAILQSKPDGLIQVHTIGDQESCTLYKINF